MRHLHTYALKSALSANRNSTNLQNMLNELHQKYKNNETVIYINEVPSQKFFYHQNNTV